MKMITFLLFFTFFGCKSITNDGLCRVLINDKNADKYGLELKCGFSKSISFSELEYRKTILCTYASGESVFISNEVEFKPSFFTKISFNDSGRFGLGEEVMLNGIDKENNLHWKIIGNEKFIYGYFDVNEDHIDAFENYLKSLRRM